MTDNPTTARPLVRSTLSRGVLLFGFWLLLAGPETLESAKAPGADAAAALAGDLVVGMLATAFALWVSLIIAPPRQNRIRYGALARLAGRFLSQATFSGLDVAQRAFDPRLPINPGFLAYPVRLPPGSGRAAFGAMTSLIPGTVPVGTDANDALVYHCLDLDDPVATGLRQDEVLLMDVLGVDRGND